MQVGFISKKNQLISRRSLLGLFGASLVSAAPVFTNAAGFIKGAGDIRKLKMISHKTGERQTERDKDKDRQRERQRNM